MTVIWSFVIEVPVYTFTKRLLGGAERLNNEKIEPLCNSVLRLEI